MSDKNGFAAAPVADDFNDVEGGEADNASPKEPFARSPIGVLKSLSNRPLQQAIQCIKYVDSTRERERKLLRAITPEALLLVASNGPEYNVAVQALSE
jgi:hypothetical protein